jgi:hypothetical protein
MAYQSNQVYHAHNFAEWIYLRVVLSPDHSPKKLMVGRGQVFVTRDRFTMVIVLTVIKMSTTYNPGSMSWHFGAETKSGCLAGCSASNKQPEH